MFEINLLEWLGYAASIVVAVSLLMSSIIRLRWLNLGGSLLFSVYGFLIGSYPVGMVNLFITLVNIWYLSRFYSRKESFKLIETNEKSKFVNEFLNVYKEEISRIFPSFETSQCKGTAVYYIIRNLNIAGILVGKKSGEKIFDIVLDFVTPEYRDFKLGKFIYIENKDFFSGMGVSEFRCIQQSQKHNTYLSKMGFDNATENGKSFFVKKIKG